MKSRTGDQVPFDQIENRPAIVYCICRKPDSGKWMIGCDGCDDWFHGECVHLRQEDEDLVDQYFCPSCKQRGLGATTWKRKCRLPGCNQPARTGDQPPSKYCCAEHGTEFFRSQHEHSAYSCGELVAAAQVVNSAQDFHRLGEPLPQPRGHNISTGGVTTPFQHQTEASLARSSLERRSTFLGMAKERQKRIGDDLRGEIEQGTKGIRDICGYDLRLALDDQEFMEWCDSEEGQSILALSRIDGKDKLCLKRKCDKHKYWLRIAMEDIELEERIISESSV